MDYDSYIARLDKFVTCCFDYDIEPEQVAILCGPVDNCQPGFAAEVEITNAYAPDDSSITFEEIMAGVDKDELRQAVLEYNQGPDNY